MRFFCKNKTAAIKETRDTLNKLRDDLEAARKLRFEDSEKVNKEDVEVRFLMTCSKFRTK